jgi:hypothetical protein
MPILMVQGGRMNLVRKYRPAIVIFLLGSLFIVFPILAGLLLGGGLIFISFVYASLIKAWHSGYSSFQQAEGFNDDSFRAEVFSQGEPSFRNISITAFKRYY